MTKAKAGNGLAKRKLSWGASEAVKLFWTHLSVAIDKSQLDNRAKMHGYVRARDLKRLEAELDNQAMHAMQHGQADTYYSAASIKAIFAKNETITANNGDDVALGKWHASERKNRRTNRRLRLTDHGRIGSQYYEYIRRARVIIRDILGESFPFEEMARRAHHGPGVAIGCGGLATSGAFKYASPVYTVSNAGAQLFRDTVLTDTVWSNLVVKNKTKLQIVDDCDKLAFVPKNWKTSRTIGVGPLGNIYLQLGVGACIDVRLKRVGIDIHDQSNNQQAALSASLQLGAYGDDYVTLDLAAASDSITIELVRLLLPESWFRVMNCLRTSFTMLPDGSKVWNHKFCAMGNGFTFPLETLIFYALAQAVRTSTVHKNRIWVYGDDIIVPRGMSLLLIEVLRWCGFEINNDKTFIHGLFYESCGADYLGGVPVRPIYWKRALRDVSDLYCVINGYGKHLSELPYSMWADHFRDHLICAHRDSILFGPPQGEFDDGEIPDNRVCTSERHLWHIKCRRSQSYCKVLQKRPAVKLVSDDGAYLQARHGLSVAPRSNQRLGVILMGGIYFPLDLIFSETKPKEKLTGKNTRYSSIRMATPGTRWMNIS